MNASASNCGESTDVTPESWALVDFDVPSSETELVADLLWSMGVLAVEERTSEPGRATLRTSLGDDPVDHISRVCSRFANVTAQVLRLPTTITETWREHASFTMVNERVALVPAWIAPPEGVTPILIEPRDTFGLGNHPTTFLALRMALKHVAPTDHVLDLGCGSGVLAIGVSRLVGNQCDVFDIADTAESTVMANCALNNVTKVRWNDNFEHESYDVVLANILAPVLRAESARITSITTEGGIVVLSGMRDDQVKGVEDSYDGWSRIDEESCEGWSCLVLRRVATSG